MLGQRISSILSACNMQISNSKLCQSSKCWVYSAVNHPWWMSMLFHRRGLLWLGSAVRYSCTFRADRAGKSGCIQKKVGAFRANRTEKSRCFQS